jgi:hypothetical protein
MIENYLSWKREKDMYPPQWTPEQWAEELLMSEARVRINILKDLLETDLDPIEFAVKVQSIVYDPLEDLMLDDE